MKKTKMKLKTQKKLLVLYIIATIFFCILVMISITISLVKDVSINNPSINVNNKENLILINSMMPCFFTGENKKDFCQFACGVERLEYGGKYKCVTNDLMCYCKK